MTWLTNKTKVDEKPYTDILIYFHIAYVPIKYPSHAKINCVNPLYLYNDKRNGCNEEKHNEKKKQTNKHCGVQLDI